MSVDDAPAPSAMPSLIAHWRRQGPLGEVRPPDAASVSASESITVSDSAAIVVEPSAGSLALDGHAPIVAVWPDVLLQAAVVVLGDRRAEGRVIAGLSVAWFEIIAQIERDPAFLFRIPWRQLEELIAGAYERAGWPDVVLTPRSGDQGRDIIATRPGLGSIRIVDQIKAYKPGHVVTADEVRSMLGVLSTDPNVSKGLVTTTSRFAPGIDKDSRLAAFMPYRLELRDGDQVLRWLLGLGRQEPDGS